MNFIKKIAEKKIDESVHLQFQKFSRGEFKKRAMVVAKKSKNKFTITTSPEFANEFVKILAQKLGEQKTNVNGAIISTNDLKGKIDFKEVKQFQGVKKYLIAKEMTEKEILNLISEFPKNFFALSFATNDSELKIKPKAPKSGKPGKEDSDDIKPDFCKLTTSDKKIAESFVFEKMDFEKADIKHDFIINEIIVPEELKTSEDFAKIREMSKRKGKIIRTAIIDGKEFKSEFEFEA
jgi:hypothetical protein